MAKTVITTDDIDNSSGATTIEFSYAGASYSIDLGKKNQAALEKVLQPWIAVATKTSSRSKRKGRAGAGSDLAAVRAWAAENGHSVAERGRVSKQIVDAYNAAH